MKTIKGYTKAKEYIKTGDLLAITQDENDRFHVTMCDNRIFKPQNVPLEVNDFLYGLGDKKDFMGSDGMVNGKPAMQFDFVVSGKSFTAYLVNNNE